MRGVMTEFGELTPDMRLLAACARWPRTPAREAAIAEAAGDPRLDWDAFTQAVGRHRVAGFAADGLGRIEGSVPPAVLKSVRALASNDTMLNLRFAGEAVRLVERLCAAGIPVQVLKGAALMAQAYGSLSVRQSRDLDLLTPVSRIDQADQICVSAGYERLQPPPGAGAAELKAWLRWRKDYIYRHSTLGLTLELHFRPTLSPLQAERLDLWSGCRPVEIQNGLTLPAADGEALYAYLCLHGALCAWFRLKWLTDIAALTSDLSGDALESLHAAAETRGAGRASGQALLLVEALFDRPLPPALRARLMGDWRIRRLARFAFKVLTDPREPQAVRFRSTAIELARPLLVDDPRVWLHDMLAWTIDWPLVFALKLPRPLWFLYPLLRGPAWVARKLSVGRAKPA